MAGEDFSWLTLEHDDVLFECDSCKNVLAVNAVLIKEFMCPVCQREYAVHVAKRLIANELVVRQAFDSAPVNALSVGGASVVVASQPVEVSENCPLGSVSFSGGFRGISVESLCIFWYHDNYQLLIYIMMLVNMNFTHIVTVFNTPFGTSLFSFPLCHTAGCTRT